MRLRGADQGDAPALARVHAAAFEAPWPADAFLTLLQAPGVFAVAAEQEAVIAFVLMRAVAGEAEVLTLATDPAWRRRGAARALLQAGLGHAAALGADAAFLEVAADNAAALALYGAAGFEPAGRRAGYYARPGRPAADALVLRRPLEPSAPGGGPA